MNIHGILFITCAVVAVVVILMLRAAIAELRRDYDRQADELADRDMERDESKEMTERHARQRTMLDKEQERRHDVYMCWQDENEAQHAVRWSRGGKS